MLHFGGGARTCIGKNVSESRRLLRVLLIVWSLDRSCGDP